MRTAQKRKLRAAGVGLALGAVAMFFAACGGASGPGVASLGSSATSTTSPAAGTSNRINETNYLDAVKFAQCMRTHGVPNMPDPNSEGVFALPAGKNGGGLLESAQYVKANKACHHLLPNGGEPSAAGEQALIAQALKYVQCMRTHGVPSMPDPTAVKGGITQRFPLGPNSPQLQKAMKDCRSLPGGAP